MEPIYFPSPQAFREWLNENHDKETEVLVGYYKTGTGKPSLTWSESVDQALCYGWIDGVRRSVDDERYTIRFTPRKPNSNWSAVNLKKVEDLTKAGLMQPAGLKVYEARKPEKTNQYSFENDLRKLADEYEELFKANAKAWTFFEKQAPSYQKAAFWWVMSAKQDATQLKRLVQLIHDSEKGKRVDHLTPPGKREK